MSALEVCLLTYCVWEAFDRMRHNAPVVTVVNKGKVVSPTVIVDSRVGDGDGVLLGVLVQAFAATICRLFEAPLVDECWSSFNGATMKLQMPLESNMCGITTPAVIVHKNVTQREKWK